jgi:hypothetical protein
LDPGQRCLGESIEVVLDRVPRVAGLSIYGLGMPRAMRVDVPAVGVITVDVITVPAITVPAITVPTLHLPKAPKAAGVHPVLTCEVVVVLRQVQRHADPANRERQPNDRQDERLVPS